MNRSLFRTGLIALIFPLLSSGLLAELPEPDSMESHNLAVGVDYCKLEYSNLYGGTQRIYILRIDLSEPTIEVGFGVCPDGIRKNTATLGALYDGIAATNLGFAVVVSSPSVPVGLIKAEGKLYNSFSSAAELAAARELAGKLAELTLSFAMQASDDDQLFGSVSARAISDKLKADFGMDIDHTKIKLEDNIKALGTYVVDVKLHSEVVAQLSIVVVRS